MAPDIAEELFPADGSDAADGTGPGGRQRLRALTDLLAEAPLTDFATPRARAVLARAQVLVTGWGSPRIDAAALDAAPRLRAVVHTGGTVKRLLDDACWRRGIDVTSAAAANAVPVAEYTLAAILFAGKGVLAARDRYRELRGAPADWHRELAGHGNYRRTVGVVGASRVGRRVVELLRPHDLRVLLTDPYLPEEEARALGAEPAGLDELCARADVVSLHAPALPETTGMIDAARLALMRDGATLVNTARGALVDTGALTAELVSGRLNAVIDVTAPEVLPAASPLYRLPNVLLTPHIAGSLGNEVHRLAAFALDELERWTNGLPLAGRVTASGLARQA
ncbi:hydroxyacid dehydrogenase [Streptomyces capparidis]